jgi:hypothetical protein
MIQPIFVRVLPVLHGNHFRYVALTAHAHTPTTIIHFATMTALNEMPDLIGSVRKIFVEPIMK